MTISFASALHGTFNAADENTFRIDKDAEELIEMTKIVKVKKMMIKEQKERTL